MARRQTQDYDWLDDPFDEKKNQKPRSGCTGPAVVALVLVVVLVGVIGFLLIGSLGALTDVYAG